MGKIKVKAYPGEKIIRKTCHLCHGGCIQLAHVRDGEFQHMKGNPDGLYTRLILKQVLIISSVTQSIYIMLDIVRRKWGEEAAILAAKEYAYRRDKARFTNG
jgi:hypothetical protein